MLRDQFPVKMEAFDLLQLSGECLERRPYFERKDLLHTLLAVNNEDPALEYVSYDSDLLNAWAEAVNRNREGLIAKRLDSAYEHTRSYSWLKVKNWRFEACDIVGFTAGENARSSFFGSLVLEKDGKFRGCAGSGFNDWELRKFKDIFSDAPRMPLPYSYVQVGDPYTAVKVDIQVLVKFYQITENNVMRFPIFITSN
jgi:bifunctional non-homologous end joining protein LigD